MKSICFIIESFALCFLVSTVVSEKCKTPNGEDAQCVPICSCPILIKALMTFELEATAFVKKSQCGQSKDPLVCCGTSANYANQSSTSATPTSAPNKIDLLPSRRYCGYQRFDDYYHTNDTSATAIDEFPWSAALIYLDDEDVQAIKCSGSLISNRYVLTAAHCIRIFKNAYKLVGVRLGEHNVELDEDCIKDGRFDDECTDPIRDFGIEEQIVHPGYDLKHRKHDIGLIRLNRTVTYTDFVRPICLPFPGTKFAKIGDTLHQSSWGAEWFSAPTDIKKKMPVKLLPNSECQGKFQDQGFTINMTDYHTCTIEVNEYSQRTCQGDSGGPVTFSRRNQWHQEGVISLGKFCGFGDSAKDGGPNVNVKVVKYLDWILESIRS